LTFHLAEPSISGEEAWQETISSLTQKLAGCKRSTTNSRTGVSWCSVSPVINSGTRSRAAKAEIEQFRTRNYGVTFPMFAKIEVNGVNAHPLYTHLKSAGKTKGSGVFLGRIAAVGLETAMPRRPRFAAGARAYHVLNPRLGGLPFFEKSAD
jgi:hypothetical protein